MRISFFRNGSKRPYTIVDPPTGTIVVYAGSAAPTGWLLCDGTAVSQSTYAKLYAVIGVNKFGTDSGGNFTLPDFRQKAPMGAGTGNEGAGAAGGTGRILPLSTPMTDRTLGSTVGAATHTLTGQQSGIADHPHTVTEANHTHTAPSSSHKHQNGSYLPSGFIAKTGGTQYWTEGRIFNYTLNGYGFTTGPSAVTHTIGEWIANGPLTYACSYAGDTDATSPHPCAQPSLVVNYIIKT